jgi:diguanylate cyclase (GGDEF)-like protein/PAS domain S-box-containing protein
MRGVRIDSGESVVPWGEAKIFRLLVDGVRDYAIFGLDVAGLVATWNLGAQHLKGYANAEILGRHFSVFYPPEDLAAGLPDSELSAAKADGRFEAEGWRVRKDGTRFWANLVITPLYDDADQHYGFVKVTRDVTERRAADQALRDSEERFRLLVDGVRDYAIFGLDATGLVTSWNSGAEYLKGYSAAEIVGRHFSLFYPLEDLAAGLPDTELATAMIDGRFEVEGWRVRKDGTTFWADVVITPLYDDAGQHYGFVKVTRDVTEVYRRRQELLHAADDMVSANAALRRQSRELVNARDQAQSQALLDALTGLPNRQCFYDRAGLAVLAEARHRSITSVLVIDLDRFKELNDTLGHRYGDKLLCLIGPRIAPLLRLSDTVARIGGDEFAVLLPDSGGPVAVQEVAERIIAALAEPFTLDTLTFAIDASCGHASTPKDGDSVDDLLQHADAAMYIAKAADSGVVAYDQTLDINTPRRLAILNELPAAIRDGELVLHYQPKFDIFSGKVTGAEALVRWNHPSRGMVPPDEFIPPAEHSGLIKPLTTWVLNTALAQCRLWIQTTGRTSEGNLSVAVNVSARSLLDDGFPAEVVEALARHQVPPELLTIEVTETAIMMDPQRAHALLKEIHELGVELSIDDFGTGYSSLAYLKFLPVSELKIDRTFVKHMHHDNDDAVIVQSVIDLAHNLGLKTVAEGIEDQATLEQLSDLGCNLGQGYHLGRPIPADALNTLLHATARFSPSRNSDEGQGQGQDSEGQTP